MRYLLGMASILGANLIHCKGARSLHIGDSIEANLRSLLSSGILFWLALGCSQSTLSVSASFSSHYHKPFSVDPDSEMSTQVSEMGCDFEDICALGIYIDVDAIVSRAKAEESLLFDHLRSGFFQR